MSVEPRSINMVEIGVISMPSLHFESEAVQTPTMWPSDRCHRSHGEATGASEFGCTRTRRQSLRSEFEKEGSGGVVRKVEWS